MPACPRRIWVLTESGCERDEPNAQNVRIKHWRTMRLHRSHRGSGMNLIVARSSAVLTATPGRMRERKAVTDMRSRASGWEVDGWQDEEHGG